MFGRSRSDTAACAHWTGLRNRRLSHPDPCPQHRAATQRGIGSSVLIREGIRGSGKKVAAMTAEGPLRPYLAHPFLPSQGTCVCAPVCVSAHVKELS